ncbi:hypothetical protein [Paenibacillus sp. HB172176]|uniref:hypothetical protein n=1 Tax=Paenibacillus sp. HB172176 TaxID=2493690 RepID=UPI0014394F67|nr:hypothetical protein [Paenibacillus sp. HB172176]
MAFHFSMTNNVMSIACLLIGWIIILTFMIRRYRKQQDRPVGWRVFLVALFGFLSVSFPIVMGYFSFKLAVLPLGVWILYALIGSRAWPKYRWYAWRGFLANYLFLILALVSGLLNDAVYPKDDVHTYISDVNQARIVGTHPFAEEAVSFDTATFLAGLEQLQESEIDMDWHSQTAWKSESMYQKERFPYALLGVESRWGSGIEPSVYIQFDGKGLLIVRSDRSLYYTSEASLLEMGESSDE